MSDAPPTFADVAPWLAVALVGFVLFWCGITFFVSRLSGWAEIARAYPAGEVLSPSTRWRWQSALMNLNAKYSAGLILVADPLAVHFSVYPLMRSGHAPFSVPWQDIRGARRHLLFAPRIALTFARAPGVTMLIMPELADGLAAASMGRFTVPSETPQP